MLLHKALPPVEDLQLDKIRSRGWHALTGDLLLPILVIREGALNHNIEVMRRFCEDSGVSLAPHGKTTMSPQLIHRQLDAGAWGMTAANPVQARVMRSAGADRVIIANQVPDRLGLRWMALEMAANPEAEIFCLVDSVRIVELMQEALEGTSPAVQIPVLIELGVKGGRTGCRTLEQAMEVASAVARASRLRLAGVECFEGVIHGTDDETIKEVDDLLRHLRGLTESLAAAGAFAGAPEILVTAGGSTYFDRVVAVLAAGWSLHRPVRVVLRSGCYLTHDHGSYMRGGPFGGRLSAYPALQPALELWGAVHSRPEPGLAIVGFGKRDSSYDSGLPTPLRVRSGDSERPAPAGIEVFQLNDQHAFVHIPEDDPLQVGDLIGCGISHPCTIFDKWRVIPIVDDEYRVNEVAETLF
ncbi:MAG TPA: amino acid deaminase [Candidatus Dormibacteraeota bacterium]|jgi:D-serine deaminase-like pyridoxal phosphate-dependent protein|nr:amino acid deaminase [Candidatus Dormibacteraeota bacterium]